MFNESATCPRCSSTIDASQIVKHAKSERDGVEQSLQHVECKCQACGLMVEFDRAVANGVWEVVGEIRLVTAPKRHAAFDARFNDRMNRVLQYQAA